MVTFITGSAFVFFLQPVAGTVFTATLIAATALAGRPILDRIAHDFCAFPPEMSAQLRDNKFFFRISVLWSVVYFLNAAGTVWLLTSASLNHFMVLKSATAPAIIAAAVVGSWAVFGGQSDTRTSRSAGPITSPGEPFRRAPAAEPEGITRAGAASAEPQARPGPRSEPAVR